MSLNFFKHECQYPSISQESFGLCDDEDGSKAYPDLNNPTSWIAEVKNTKNLNVVFTAIDKCVILDHEFVGRGRCDGMLTTTEHLYLVELKNQRADWQSHAIDQLTSTIDFLIQNHNLNVYKKRKAFACNKKRDKFAVIDNEFNLKLFRKTGFRIDSQAEILII